MRRLAILGLLLVACAAPEPLRGIDLPPAELPQVFEPTLWTIAFSHRFDVGHWTDGDHTYSLHLDCPEAIETPVDTDDLGFAVSSTNPLGMPVFLRLAGLSTTTTGPRNVVNVSSQEETAAVISLLGLDIDQAEAAQQCDGEVRWDTVNSAPLVPSEPFRP